MAKCIISGEQTDFKFKNFAVKREFVKEAQKIQKVLEDSGARVPSMSKLLNEVAHAFKSKNKETNQQSTNSASSPESC